MTTYYVKNGGNDGNTGLSDAQAWATIRKVNGKSFNAGDDVYFKCGSSWNTKTDTWLRIDWSGVDSNNRSVVGAYYMSGGNEIVGVNGDGRPVINGGWNLITYAGSPSEKYEMLISPISCHHVTIQQFKIINSHGFAISGNTNTPCTGNLHIKYISVEDTGRAGIDTAGMGIDPIVEYCKVLRDNRQWYIGEDPNWDSGIRIKANNGICRFCEVGNGWGEGIGIPDVITSNVLIHNNLVWGRSSVGIYIGCCTLDSVVKHNIVLGTTNTAYHKDSGGGRSWNNVGISLNQEKVGMYTLRNNIYSNVVAGCIRGVQVLNKQEAAIAYKDRNYVYNNTLIDNYSNFYVHPTQCLTTEFKNNISVVHNDGVHRVHAAGNGHVWFKSIPLSSCYLPLGNFWSGTCNNDIRDWSHASDVLGDAKLSKTRGWQNISKPGDIDIAASIALTSTSDAIDTAQNLGATYDDAFIAGCNFNVADASDADTPIVVVLGDQDSYGSGWEMGAYVYMKGGTDSTPPIVTSFTTDTPLTKVNVPITLDYVVTDETSLDYVELHITTDKIGVPDEDNWILIGSRNVSGTSVSGSFVDNIQVPGTYWYGMYVFDSAGNFGVEPYAIRVVVVNGTPISCKFGIKKKILTLAQNYM